jgi:hypothetical protein
MFSSYESETSKFHVLWQNLKIFRVAFGNSVCSVWCAFDVNLPLILSEFHLRTDGVLEGFMNSVEVNSFCY